MALDFDQLKTVIHTAVVRASGLAEAKVIWAKAEGGVLGTGAPAPACPYMTMFLGRVQRIGQDVADWLFNEAAPAGEEITERAGGPRRLTLTLEAFCGPTTGNSAALSLLAKTKTRLGLPSILFHLRSDAGITVEDIEDAIDISAVRHVGFEGRAVMAVQLTTADIELDTPTGYIARVGLVDLTDDNVIAPDGYNDGGA